MKKTLSPRQKKIILTLNAQSDFMTLGQLENNLSISERTLRNDLKAVTDYLASYDLLLEHKVNLGLKLVAKDPCQLANLISDLEALEPNNYSLKQRVLFMSLYLLANGESTYEHLAEKLQASKQTIVSDFSYVISCLEADKIRINKIQGKGLALEGKEINIRNKFEKLISENPDHDVMKLVSKELQFIDYQSKVNYLIKQIEEHSHVHFAQDTDLAFNLEFTLYRYQHQHFLAKDSEKNFNYSDDTKNKELFTLLSNYAPNITEGKYLMHFFVNARLANQTDLTGYENPQARKLAEFLFKKLRQLQSTSQLQDDKFINGLTQHLNAAIYRCSHHIQIENVLLNQIMNSIPLIYEFTKTQLSLWEKEHNLEFSNNEIAYIAMYIASAYESSLQKATTLKVLLRCTFGITTSAILKSRIFAVIPECRLVGPFDMRQTEEYLSKHHADLIISTASYTHDSIPVIVVNPLLYQDDIDDIKNRITQLSYDKMCTHFIDSYAKIPVDKKEKKNYQISDLVQAEDIQIVNEVEDWEEAIRLASKPLIKKKAIEPRYLSKMIEAVHQFGTYMVLVEGTAFVHAGPEDGINYNCTAILVVKKPFKFGIRNPKIVSNIVIIGIKDKKENSLLNLVYIFEKKENRQILAKENIDLKTIEHLRED